MSTHWRNHAKIIHIRTDSLDQPHRTRGRFGEIINHMPAHPSWHTHTDMGNGGYPYQAWGLYMRNLWYWTGPASTAHASIFASRTNAACYDATAYHNHPNWGTYLRYGGNGYNASCL